MAPSSSLTNPFPNSPYSNSLIRLFDTHIQYVYVHIRAYTYILPYIYICKVCVYAFIDAHKCKMRSLGPQISYVMLPLCLCYAMLVLVLLLMINVTVIGNVHAIMYCYVMLDSFSAMLC